jgi:hypothetical protein
MFMSPAIRKFLELEYRKAEMKKYWEELDAATQAVAAEIGLNSYFQDPVSGSVYKIVKPEGRFVDYKDIGYVRTKRGDEKRGDLSVKEAEEAGFKVSK